MSNIFRPLRKYGASPQWTATREVSGLGVWLGGLARTLFGVMLGFCIAPASAPASALASDGPSDVSLDLPVDEIIVSGGRLGGAQASAVVFALDQSEIGDSRAPSLSGLLRRAPGASVQTNSRGESLVYLRGAGERQTAVFFGGAAINIPWDNRLNLDLFPAAVLSDVHITPGPASVLFGANTAGGVIELSPSSFSLEPQLLVSGEIGEAGVRDWSVLGASPFRGMEITTQFGRQRRTGVPLSQKAALDFFQSDDDIRTNTDARATNGMFRLAYDQRDDFQLSGTVLVIDSEFGIAPEGREDPALSRPRFWRYPNHRNVIGVLNAKYTAPGGTSIATAFWSQHVNQAIESFVDADYAQLEDRQEDRDRSYGWRTLATHDFGNDTIRGSFSVLDARHVQTDRAFDGGLPGDTTQQSFRRRTFSLGAEYERSLADVSFTLGAGVDVFQSLETGLSESAGGLSAWSAIAAANWRARDNFSITASLARKPRLPTQRELYGDGVGRFVINPDLKPETPFQFELAAHLTGDHWSLTAVPFVSITSNTIDRESIEIDGRNFRRRVNIDGSRGFGIDVAGSLDVSQALKLEGNISLLNLRRREGVAGARFIAERPSVLGSLALDYDTDAGVGARIEAMHRGRAFGQDRNDAFIALPRSTQINAEISYRFQRGDGSLEIYLRGDNLTDALVEPQLGLPDPGRWIKSGIRGSLR